MKIDRQRQLAPLCGARCQISLIHPMSTKAAPAPAASGKGQAAKKIGASKGAKQYTYLAKGISTLGRSVGFRKRALKVHNRCACLARGAAVLPCAVAARCV